MHSAQYDVLSPAAKPARLGVLGWHDLRHSYRTWLDQTGRVARRAEGHDAPRFDDDDHEHLWSRYAGGEARSAKRTAM
jgi:hypothetical protein